MKVDRAILYDKKFKRHFAAIVTAVLGALLVLGCQKDSKSKNDASDQFAGKTNNGPQFKLFDPAEMDKFMSGSKLSVQDREQAILAMKLTFKNSYVGYYSKKSLIGISGDEVFDACLIENRKLPEPIASLEYSDLIRVCLAGFRDSHLNMSSGSKVFVTSAIANVLEVNGKILISEIRPNVLAHLIAGEASETEKQNLTKIQVGTQILEINGVNVVEIINELSKMISGSSPAAVRRDALSQLFTRKFSYPLSSELVVKLQDARQQQYVVRLPWLQLPAAGSFDSKYELGKRQILPASDLSAANQFTVRSGLNEMDPVFLLADKKQYQGAGEVVLVTGTVVPRDKSERPACYFQLNTFSIDQDQDGIFRIQPGNLDLVDLTSQYLESCQQQDYSLIVDIRNNGGGNSDLAFQLMRVFSLDAEKLPFDASALYVNSGNFPTLMQMLKNLDLTKKSMPQDLQWKSIAAGISREDKVSDWLLSKERNILLQAPYRKAFVVLIGAGCVSACEIFARGLKGASKAVIVGEPTNGTGFGFQSWSNVRTVYRDPWNNFYVNIPNFAFSVLPTSASLSLIDSSLFTYAILPFTTDSLLENRPLQPDLSYQLQEQDMYSWVGYREFILDQLK